MGTVYSKSELWIVVPDKTLEIVVPDKTQQVEF